MASRLADKLGVQVDYDLRQYILAKETPDYEGMASVYGISFNAIQYRRRVIKGIDNIGANMRRKPGPARVIQPYMIEGVIELLASRPLSYQDKVAHFLFNEYSIKVTQPTISKLLKEL